MTNPKNQYSPDYAVPPGWVLQEWLEVEEISQAEFARRCGRSPKLISEIISGKAPLEPATALEIEKVLGVDAGVWLGIESAYRLREARLTEAKNAGSAADWLKSFPVSDLVKRGCFLPPESNPDAVSKLLTFFRVGSIGAWRSRYCLENVAYRHSPSFKSSEAALATWHRLGEIEADRQECTEYSKSRFRHATQCIRQLTPLPIEEALPQAMQFCNEAGVALAVVQPLPRVALSGAAWWISPTKAVIQLTARHKTDDHLWFSFFHEAAHILLHSKKSVFVDEPNGNGNEQETEANEWARDLLVPGKDWEKFVSSSPRSARSVTKFAEQQGIAPGIVVGMLQHEGRLPWRNLNGLKVKLTWRLEGQ